MGERTLTEAKSDKDPKVVQGMFARIAGRYDLANRVLSGGVDTRWRRRVVKRAGGDLSGQRAVDVACGTGDLAVVLDRAGADVLGVDFTFEMLEHAPAKLRPGVWVQGDALAMPVSSGSADVVTMAFGLRNVVDRRQCFRELLRITKPGGKVLILEFGMPDRDLFGRVYRSYLTHVLPRIGGALSGDRAAYRYLDSTVQEWPDAHQLSQEMLEDGFASVDHERLFRGVACLHVAVAPSEV
ncbi:UbiE/COQ5 methyltransferase [Planctomycetes bacterium Poly30]|uniref:Demethylmenaquinone methyltransferase n=1 Tax=Saltatorellus ferox TaxID=2528018 RepID=A0A518ES19_9BACT|nr:UbiE/COQ5 methyltransferase [Planctomycetes bacterium Poly30]